MSKNRLKESPKVLGLDVSTRTIGWALFDIQTKELLELTHVSPVPKPKEENKIKELILKSEIFKTKLVQYKDLGITKVIIEEPLLNSNNVYTVATLLKFNGMISKVVSEVLNVIPEFISSNDARRYSFPELVQKRTHNKKGEPYKQKDIDKASPVLFGEYPWEVDKKMVIWEKVANLEPQIVWEYDRNQNLKKENFDMTDSYACVRAVMCRDGIWDCTKK